MHRQAIPSPCCSCSKHTGINGPAHACQQVIRDTGEITLDDVSGSGSLGCENIAFDVGVRLIVDQSDVSTPPWIIFDAFDQVWPWSISAEIYYPEPPFVTTAPVSDSYVACMVPPAS